MNQTAANMKRRTSKEQDETHRKWDPIVGEATRKCIIESRAYYIRNNKKQIMMNKNGCKAAKEHSKVTAKRDSRTKIQEKKEQRAATKINWQVRKTGIENEANKNRAKKGERERRWYKIVKKKLDKITRRKTNYIWLNGRFCRCNKPSCSSFRWFQKWRRSRCRNHVPEWSDRKNNWRDRKAWW